MTDTIRVFPRRTSYTPADNLAFIGDPPLWRPEASAVMVSVCFVWDIPEGLRLQKAWGRYYDNVQIGGPAFGAWPEGFQPGLFVRPGITFTSRGCPRHCRWCLVPEREGDLRLVSPISPGNVIADNNFLACPKWHRMAVYEMLSQQSRAAVFAGGLQASLVTPEVAGELRQIRISEVFLAADTESALHQLRHAVECLTFLGRKKLRCYMLLGFGNDTIDKAIARLEEAWEIGVMPFAQLYQPASGRISYNAEWRKLAKLWSRPAAMAVAHTGTVAQLPRASVNVMS